MLSIEEQKLKTMQAFRLEEEKLAHVREVSPRKPHKRLLCTVIYYSMSG
jgi:hypothetical protein